ncbi:MAG: hypothetical protein GF331_18165, partial [Chitinivibrionales bacterium]|nr:hypothetical protein [Chitinivibrionales bacterium]
AYTALVTETLRPLLEEALSDSSITAWVAANDPTAMACLRYLAEQRVRVPQDISLIGFDNSTDAFIHGLTSYDFNCPVVVQRMLAHILDPASLRRIQRGTDPIEVKGFLSRRATLAKCSRAPQQRRPCG